MAKLKMGKLKTMYTGKILTVKQREVDFGNGYKETFEYCERPDSVTIMAFDNKKRLLLIKEMRHGQKKLSWFLPAGRVEKKEQPTKAAHRELREETGYDAKYFKKIFCRPSGSSVILWNVHVYVAKDIFISPLKGDEQTPIEVIPTPLKKAVEMALDGIIENEFIAYHIVRFHHMLKTGKFKW